MNKNVKIICFDNSGENRALDEDFAKNFEEIYFVFMLLVTTQQNGMVEW